MSPTPEGGEGEREMTEHAKMISSAKNRRAYLLVEPWSRR